MNFSKTIENLRSESDNSIAKECLSSMTNGTVLFNSGFDQEKEKLISLYELRLDIAKSINRHKFREEELLGWEQAIKKLKNCNTERLWLNWVRSDKKHFRLIWNAESGKLIGIFYLYPKRTMEESEAYNSETVKKGYTVSSVKYVNGQMAKAWK